MRFAVMARPSAPASVVRELMDAVEAHPGNDRVRLTTTSGASLDLGPRYRCDSLDPDLHARLRGVGLDVVEGDA